MKCVCGFRFAGPAEFRNCEAFVTFAGRSGVICPQCSRAYIGGREVTIVDGCATDVNPVEATS